MTDLVEAYAATVVSIALPGHGWVDAAKAVRTIGRPMHVVTAWNPGESRPGIGVNRGRNRDLRNRLAVPGTEIHCALGASPSGDHYEESYAITGMSRADALAVGREFGQAAIFEVTADNLVVVSSDGAWERRRPHEPS
jgi:hypothetical protein